MSEESEVVTADKLIAGDRPSTFITGVLASQSLQKARIAVFMIDVLGRVVLMPPGSVQVLTPPRISEEELDALAEEDAIRVLTAQGDTEPQIIEYLKGRDDRAANVL